MLIGDRAHLLKNERGKLVGHTESTALAGRLGWWNGIAAGDIDAEADGDIDHLVSNYGLNTKYKVSPEKPEIVF